MNGTLYSYSTYVPVHMFFFLQSPAAEQPNSGGTAPCVERRLCLESFVKFCESQAAAEAMRLMRSFRACGYNDLLQAAASLGDKWTRDMDESLARWVDRCRDDFGLASGDILPGEVELTEEQLHSPEFYCLREASAGAGGVLGRRFAELRSVNDSVVADAAPLVAFGNEYPGCLSALFRGFKGMLFKQHKTMLLRNLLTKSSGWSESTSSSSMEVQPEVVLDAVAQIGRDSSTTSAEEEEGEDEAGRTWFFQTMSQLRDAASAEMLVPPARGGDPRFPFRVRLLGEEVHGTSGSFRQFLHQACQELQASSSSSSFSSSFPSTGLLTPTLDDESGHRGQFFLRPGRPCTALAEEMLRFLGQLLGMVLRAVIPLELKLVPAVWKVLVGELLREEEVATYNPTLQR